MILLIGGRGVILLFLQECHHQYSLQLIHICALAYSAYLPSNRVW